MMWAAVACAQERVVLRAGELIDGKGGVLRDQRVVVEGGKIVAVEAFGKGAKADYDLSGMTLMPGGSTRMCTCSGIWMRTTRRWRARRMQRRWCCTTRRMRG